MLFAFDKIQDFKIRNTAKKRKRCSELTDNGLFTNCSLFEVLVCIYNLIDFSRVCVAGIRFMDRVTLFPRLVTSVSKKKKLAFLKITGLLEMN